MRFEAKHSYFKQLALSMGNFINLPKSLACRHQELQCYRLATKTPTTRLTIGPCEHNVQPGSLKMMSYII